MTQCWRHDSPFGVMVYLQNRMEALWLIILTIPDILVAFFYLFVSKPKKNVAKEIVLVTGSGQGMGRELCLRFARLGSEIVCVDIAAENNLETVRQVREIGVTVRSYICNVADRTAVMKLAKQVGRVDILINNAGVFPFKGLWDSSEKELRTIVDINLMSQLWTVQAFLPGMKQRDHGHIVSISSIAGLSGYPYQHAYAVAKAGLTALMQTLSHELRMEKKHNIKLTTVYPYFVKTRQEIKNCIVARFPALEVDFVVNNIVRGILEELVTFTIPRDYVHAFNLMNILPTEFADRWYTLNFFKSITPKEDVFKIELESGHHDHTGNIEVQ